MGPEAGGPPRRRWIQADTNVVEPVNGQIELMRRKLPTLKLKLPWRSRHSKAHVGAASPLGPERPRSIQRFLPVTVLSGKNDTSDKTFLTSAGRVTD
jgi:hypothetical protein